MTWATLCVNVMNDRHGCVQGSCVCLKSMFELVCTGLNIVRVVPVGHM